MVSDTFIYHDTFIYDQFAILDKQKQFYESIYQSREYDNSNTQESVFFKAENITPLSLDDQKLCDGPFTDAECINAINGFKKDKTPARARGYPEALLNDDLCKISTVSRNEALRPSAKRDSTESRVPLVLTYNQFNTGTKRILLDNFEMLLSDPATHTIFPELPLVSYRRDRNRRDNLVHSAERSDADAGTFACSHPHCLTC